MKILIGYDGSLCAASAVEDLRCAGLPDAAEALVLSVTPMRLPKPESFGVVPYLFEGKWSDRIHASGDLAEVGAKRVQELFPQWAVSAEGAWGSPSTVLLEKADSWGARLIVVGSHGRSPIARWFAGTVSQAVATGAHCSVRVARGMARAPGHALRVLIGQDGSPEADEALSSVCSRSWPANTEFRIIGAFEAFRPPLSELDSQIAESIDKSLDEERSWLKEKCDSALTRLQKAGLTGVSLVVDGD